MLTIDIAGLSKPHLEHAIASHCAVCGTVQTVKVLMPNDHSEYAVAVVNMATPAEAAAVDHKFGNAKVGSTAIIRLQQEFRPLPE